MSTFANGCCVRQRWNLFAFKILIWTRRANVVFCKLSHTLPSCLNTSLTYIMTLQTYSIKTKKTCASFNKYLKEKDSPVVRTCNVTEGHFVILCKSTPIFCIILFSRPPPFFLSSLSHLQGVQILINPFSSRSSWEPMPCWPIHTFKSTTVIQVQVWLLRNSRSRFVEFKFNLLITCVAHPSIQFLTEMKACIHGNSPRFTRMEGCGRDVRGRSCHRQSHCFRESWWKAKKRCSLELQPQSTDYFLLMSDTSMRRNVWVCTEACRPPCWKDCSV